jgi:hypothetical protein
MALSTERLAPGLYRRRRPPALVRLLPVLDRRVRAPARARFPDDRFFPDDFFLVGIPLPLFIRDPARHCPDRFAVDPPSSYPSMPWPMILQPQW